MRAQALNEEGTTIEVAIRVLGLDLEDPTVSETLEASMGAGMVQPHNECAVVPFFVNEESVQDGVTGFVRRFRAVLPQTEVVGLDGDLVNHTEIAGRVGVSPETVLLWAKEGAFPIPVSSVGPKGGKVYEWAHVAHWLDATGRDPEAPGELPTSAQRVQLVAAVAGAATEPPAVQSTLDSRAAQGDSTSPLSVPGKAHSVLAGPPGSSFASSRRAAGNGRGRSARFVFLILELTLLQLT